MPTLWQRPGHVFDAAAAPVVPAEAYSDPGVFAAELRHLFAPSAGLVYLSHDALLPTKGHQRSDSDPRIVLTRDGDKIVALANLCTHACRPLVDDDAPVAHTWIRCPYHDWSFRGDGSLIGGGNIDFGTGEAAETIKTSLALPSFDLLSWHGFHFGVDTAHIDEYRNDLARIDDDFAARGIEHWLDLDGWVVATTQDDPYRGDWKTFVEVFGDCYHVPPYHPGLASFIDCASIEWTFGDNFHAQFLQLSNERGNKSEHYSQWSDGLHRYYELRGEPEPTMAVGWVGIYPNLMFEVYNGLKVFSVVVPIGPDEFVNRVHYCVPADMDQLVPGLSKSIIAAYDETVIEDRALVERRSDGLSTAASLGLDIERYHVNLSGDWTLEAGVAHFHDWWTRRQPVRA
ncbi:MAG: SRPBCC family protein [Actinomycetota bacterium]